MAIETSTAILGAAGLQAGGSLAGGKKGANAARDAANIQAAAAREAIAFQREVYEKNTQNLQPYMDFGKNYLGPLDTQIGKFLAQPDFKWEPTMAQLEQTPGYQFTRDQGLKATQNQLTTTGGGAQRGGTSIANAAQYATNLASTTYNQQFQNQLALWNAQQGQGQARIAAAAMPVTSIGLPAAGALAGVGLQSASQIGNSLSQMGAAQASGVVGAANSQIAGMTGATNAAGSLASNLLMMDLIKGAKLTPAA